MAAAEGGFQPTKTPSLSGSAVSYLIITNDGLAPAFQVLADYKTAQGMPAVVATRELIAGQLPPRRRHPGNHPDVHPGRLREVGRRVRPAGRRLGHPAAALRRATPSIPTDGYTAIPVDLYFACLDGNWNADGDTEFGEPYDRRRPGRPGCDFAEEVYVGRAPVSTRPQAATVFVNKIITYESTPAGSGWTNRTLFAAEVLFPSDFDVQQLHHPGRGPVRRSAGQRLHHAVHRHGIHPDVRDRRRRIPWDVPLTRAALIDTLNTGHYGIVNQIGHGFFFNMSVGDANFITTDADALINGDHLFLIYALNCASAAFDNSCLMERFVQNPNGGSIVLARFGRGRRSPTTPTTTSRSSSASSTAAASAGWAS